MLAASGDPPGASRVGPGGPKPKCALRAGQTSSLAGALRAIPRFASEEHANTSSAVMSLGIRGSKATDQTFQKCL